MSILSEIQDEFRTWVETWTAKGAVVTDFVRAARFSGDQSQHQFALAADFGFNSNPPALIEEIRADAAGHNFVAVLEPFSKAGPHLHVQRFRAGLLAQCGFFPGIGLNRSR